MVFLSNLLVDSRPCGLHRRIAYAGEPGADFDQVGAVGETDNSKYKSLYDTQAVIADTEAGFLRNAIIDRRQCTFVLSY